MARIPLLRDDDPALSDDQRTFLGEAGKARGRVLNIYRAMANRPEAGRAFSDMIRTVYRSRSSLSPRHAELSYLTATVTNNCFYWIPTHTALGRSVGLTEDQMRHLSDDVPPAGVYDAAEAAIVHYARKATRLEAIDDATYGALAAHFSTQQIMDICLTVGLSNMVNRFHATFLTDVDEETIADVETGDRVAGSCPIPRPARPGG